MGPLFPRELGRRETRTQLPASSITGVGTLWVPSGSLQRIHKKILGTRANPPTVQRGNTQGNWNQIPQYLIQLFTKQRGQNSQSFAYHWQMVFVCFITNKTILLDNTISFTTDD